MTTDALRARLDAAMSEADWQQQVAQFARFRGWLVFHARPARTARGWATPVQYDGMGYPDLTLVRDGRAPVWVELKSGRGKATAEQARWLAALEAVTLWVAHAHLVAVGENTPRLALLSPEPGSGKTRTLEVLELLCPAPMFALSASTPATFGWFACPHQIAAGVAE